MSYLDKRSCSRSWLDLAFSMLTDATVMVWDEAGSEGFQLMRLIDLPRIGHLQTPVLLVQMMANCWARNLDSGEGFQLVRHIDWPRIGHL